MQLQLFSLLIFLSLATSAAAGPSCPPGFLLVNNNKCFQYFSNRLKHLEAETDCLYFGGTLATVKNAIDNRGLFTLASNAGAATVWMGIYCFNQNLTSCYFDDNSGTVGYSNFAVGYPNTGSGYGGCVYMSTKGSTAMQWLSAPCEVAGMPFICEAPVTVDDKCLYNYNGNCYYPSTDLGVTTVNTTFSRAQSICRSKGMMLLSVHSMLEMNYVKDIYRSLNVPQIYLGAQALMPDTFSWTDGSVWDFEYFDPLNTNKAICLQMDLSSPQDSGKWSQVSCQTSNYFMCKTPAGQNLNTGKNEDQGEVKVAKVENRKVQKLDFADFSNCNTTLYMAPGVITSFGYPSNIHPVASCTWRIAALGPYRVGLYFTDFSTHNHVVIKDENGFVISQPNGSMSPFKVLGATNILDVSYTSSPYDATYNYYGFEATALPF